MQIGARNLVSLNSISSDLSQLLIPDKTGSESEVFGRSLGVGRRLSKLLIWNGYATYYSILAQHEVFGHGARAREFGYKDISYRFFTPFPFGGGGGHTHWYPDPFPPSLEHRIAFALGGVEADAVMADEIRLDWLRTGRLDGNTAQLYLYARTDLMRYILATGEGADRSNDIRTYIDVFNSHSRDNPSDSSPIRIDALKIGSLVVLLDPFIWFSAWGAVSYIWTGERYLEYPSFQFGSWALLSGLDYRLTPFGSELLWDIMARNNEKVFLFRFGKGLDGFAEVLDAELEGLNLVTWMGIRLDASFSFWFQPQLMFVGENIDEDLGRRIGSGQSATLTSPPLNSSLPISLSLGVSRKSAGYLAGERLDATMTFRVGMVLSLK